MKTLYYNAHLLDESTDCAGSVVTEDGVITKVIHGGVSKDFSGESATFRRVDLHGLTLTPSFIDLHTHLRDPGLTYKEDIASGLNAARAGGFSTIVAMANTVPVISSKELALKNMQKAKNINNGVHLIQAVSITRNFDGRDYTHIAGLDSSITPIISEDGRDVESDAVMKGAMECAAKSHVIVACHCQSSNSDMRVAEDEATKRNLQLALISGCRVHICHVSTFDSVNAIREAKKLGGGNITCEVTPHHLLLTEDATKKVNPPLRTQRDIDALISAIIDGTVDAISSDHAPHSKEDKAKGCPGFSGLETSFSAINTAFNKYHIDKKLLSHLMAAAPARILSLKQGTLQVGQRALFTVLDMTKKWAVKGEDFLSRGKYSAFEGMTLTGRVEGVIW